MSLDKDALAELARNRGLKLVASRLRTPGKPGFGLFGLADPSGNGVFGMEGKAPAATPDEVAGYLRGTEIQDWKASLKEFGVSKRSRGQSPLRTGSAKPTERANGQSGSPISLGSAEPSPNWKKLRAPEPEPELREATRTDAPALAALFATLGHDIEPPGIARNLLALEKDDLPVLVIACGSEVLAVCGLARTMTPHRPSPVGRITVLIVADRVQRQGFGKRLVQEAERRLAAAGCTLLEVTSNDRLTGAHAFYRRLGFERTSMRFAKPLALG